MNAQLMHMLGLAPQGMGISDEERRRALMARGMHPGGAGTMAGLYENPGASPQGDVALEGLRNMMRGPSPDPLAPKPRPQMDPATVQLALQALHGLTQRGQGQGQTDPTEVPGEAAAMMAVMRPSSVVATSPAKKATSTPSAPASSGGEQPMAKMSNSVGGGEMEGEAAAAATSMGLAAATGGTSALAEAAIMGGLSLAGSAFGGSDPGAAAQKKHAQTEQRQAGFQRVADLGSLIEQRNLATKQLLAGLRR